MKLSSLLADFSAISIQYDVEITGIAEDSRLLEAGDLFLAFRGEHYDATCFISQAALSGAAVILCEGLGEPYQEKNCWVYYIEHLKQSAPLLIARFYEYEKNTLNLIGVTGTNGKTSIAYWLAQALDGGYMGTLGNGYWKTLNPTANTTSSSLVIHKHLSSFNKDDIKCVAIEVSSHALALYRVEGLRFSRAVFTNLTHEHLDFHGDMEHYYQAKRKLFFTHGLQTAIINIDCAYGRRLCAEITGVNTITYGIENSDAMIHINRVHYDISGTKASVSTPIGSFDVNTSFLCAFNLSNLLSVIAVLMAEQYNLMAIRQKIESLLPVKGRMERMHLNPTVVIDYAHSPDALEKALYHLKSLTKGRLLCVFGCGGDRDKEKRPLMGRIAGVHADDLIITNDNPRNEEPQVIANEIASGVEASTRIVIELDRAEAIAKALRMAAADDVVLIAGKGHEDYQIIKGKTLKLSDHDIVNKLI